MLPTRPRLAARSMRSSCTTPAPMTATRVSCGVTLMRISSLTELFQQGLGLVERQAHDAGIAAAQLDHEAPGAALDRVGARLVVALAARRVLRDLLGGERLQLHFGARQRNLELVVVLERDRRQHLVAPVRERAEHVGSLGAVARLAENLARE